MIDSQRRRRRRYKRRLGTGAWWRRVTGWSEVIASDDPSRGGKLATFAVYLLDECNLAGSSISNYLWALRTYMKFCRQLDPDHSAAVRGLY